MALLIKGGRVIDPASGLDGRADILIEKGKIISISKSIPAKEAKVIDASGLVVCPGLIDMHTHLREPGREDEETIATGSRAAAKGGITSVVCMANTSPVIDNLGVVEFIYSQARKTASVRVYPVGSITRGLMGEELSDIGELHSAGVVAISDDGHPVKESEIMRRALEYSKMFNLPVISHCEDESLSAGGIMNEGYVSTLLGIPGIPKEAEEVMVARDIALAALAGGRLHIAHVSTAGSVDLIRKAKKKGIKVTGEATPHHFSLTDEAVKGFDTSTRVNPPLRTTEDVKAIKDGLKDGTIDAIATDHAPHTVVEKDVEYNLAPSGMVGLETAVGLILTELVGKGILSLAEAIAKMTYLPASILGLAEGRLSVGAKADITIIDPLKEWIVEPASFLSKSKNSPFGGKSLQGKAVATIVSGKVVMREEDVSG